MLTRGQKRTHSEGIDDENTAQDIDRNYLEENNVRTTEAKRSKISVPRILDGKFFLILKNVDGKIEAMCTQCKESRKGQLTSSRNFKNHYRNKHASIVSVLEDYLKNQSIEHTFARQSSLTEFTTSMNSDKVSAVNPDQTSCIYLLIPSEIIY